jgi:hypothetical protein
MQEWVDFSTKTVMRTIHKVSAFRFLSESRQIYKDVTIHRDNFSAVQEYWNQS